MFIRYPQRDDFDRLMLAAELDAMFYDDHIVRWIMQGGRTMKIPLNNVNWRDEHDVISLCRRLGAGNCVVKFRSRPNYNIMRKDRADKVVDHENVLLIYVCTPTNEVTS